MGKWKKEYISDQSGKLAIITGASSGIGLEAAKILAKKNSNLVLAVKNIKKTKNLVKDFGNYNGDISIINLDLASLNSVKNCSQEILSRFSRVDILINNAGIMACPFSNTSDGFEIQMGINHLGHFALTAYLFPLLSKTKDSRIVNVSSIAHNSGNINFEDINWSKRKYKTWSAYSDSKLANLLFTYEFARRMENKFSSPIIVASHPGYTDTDLQRHSKFFKFTNKFIAQRVEVGALASLRAAFDKKAKNGYYYGSPNFFQMFGHPEKVKSNKLSYNEKIAKKLWCISEELTGLNFDF